jgi:hypothetical protein
MTHDVILLKISEYVKSGHLFVTLRFSMYSMGDCIRTSPKVKPQIEPIQTKNRKNCIWFGFI